MEKAAEFQKLGNEAYKLAKYEEAASFYSMAIKSVLR